MKKTLQDLTIKDNFMFGAVMTDPENCRADKEATWKNRPWGKLQPRSF